MFDVSLLFGNISAFIMSDPMLRLTQGGLMLLAFLLLYLLFYTLRDVLLRTHSFPYQFFCIVLVALLPIAGFLLYLLIRPARTIKERETEWMLWELHEHLLPHDEPAQTPDAAATSTPPSVPPV